MKIKQLTILFLPLLILVFLFSAAALADGVPEKGPPAVGSRTIDNVEEGETLDSVKEDETLPLNKGTINDNFGIVEANGSTGLIHNNYGTIELNQESGSIWKNYSEAVIMNNEGSVGVNEQGWYDEETGEEIYPPAFILNNSGSVQSNEGTIENNSGEIKNNEESGTVLNNTGSIDDNYGVVFHNTGEINWNEGEGSVLNAAGGVIGYNDGTVYCDGGEVSYNGNPDRTYVKIPFERDEHALVTGASVLDDPDSDLLSAFAGEAWKKQDSSPSGTSVTISPTEGYVIDGVDFDASDNGDGTWTLYLDDHDLNGFSATVFLHARDDVNPDAGDDDGVCITVTDAEMMEFWFNYACREKILNAEENAVVDLDLTAGWDRLQLMTLDALRRRPDVRAWLLLPKGEILALPAGFAVRVPECNTVSLATLRSLLKAA